MKRKKENTLMRKMTIRVLLLFAVLLIISVMYSFFLIRVNGISNMQKICYDESAMMTILIDNMMYDMEAVATNFSSEEEVLTLLEDLDVRDSVRIRNAFHMIENRKPSFLTHKYFHSFCLMDRNKNSYFSFNNPGVSFVQDFEVMALGGNPIDPFTGFTGAYRFQSSSGSAVPFYLMSLVRDVYQFRDGQKTFLGKIIITVNIGEFLQSIQKESSFFDEAGLFNRRTGTAELLSENLSGTRWEILPEDELIEGEDGLYFCCRNQYDDVQLILYKANASFIQYADAYIIGFLVIMVCALAGAVLLMLVPVIRNLSRQIIRLEAAFEDVGNNKYDKPLHLTGSKEMLHISSGFNLMTQKIKNNTENQVLQERKHQELRFELLMAQMNPHFIYNTLNSVIYLARKNRSEDVIKVTSSFISLLQNAVYFREEGVWSTVEKELEMVEKYELIQKYRYGKRVTFQNNAEEEIRDHKIPRNILVPVIENALLHGICETDRDGTIRTQITRRQNQIHITVSDDGNGMPPETLRKVLDFAPREQSPGRGIYSIGLSNIHDRLTFLYQNEFSLHIESEPGKGTTVEIIIKDEPG